MTAKRRGKRSSRITTWLTAAEKELIEAASDIASQMTSEYVRENELTAARSVIARELARGGELLPLGEGAVELFTDDMLEMYAKPAKARKQEYDAMNERYRETYLKEREEVHSPAQTNPTEFLDDAQKGHR